MKYAVFSEKDGRKIAEATRQVLSHGLPAFRHRRRLPLEKRSGGGGGGTSGGYPAGITGCGCGSHLSRRLATITPAMLPALLDVAHGAYVGTVPTDLSNSQFGGEHTWEWSEEDGKWVTDIFRLTCPLTDPPPDPVSTGWYRMTLEVSSYDTTDSFAKTFQTALIVLEYIGEGDDCGYTFEAYCANFDPLGASSFEILRPEVTCLQFRACRICISPKRAGEGTCEICSPMPDEVYITFDAETIEGTEVSSVNCECRQSQSDSTPAWTVVPIRLTETLDGGFFESCCWGGESGPWIADADEGTPSRYRLCVINSGGSVQVALTVQYGSNGYIPNSCDDFDVEWRLTGLTAEDVCSGAELTLPRITFTEYTPCNWPESVTVYFPSTSVAQDDIDGNGVPEIHEECGTGDTPDPPEEEDLCGAVLTWNGSAYEISQWVGDDCCECEEGEECVTVPGSLDIPGSYEGDTIFVEGGYTCSSTSDCDNVYVNCCNSNTGLCYAGSYTDCQCDPEVNAALSPVGDCTTDDTCCLAGSDIGPMTECECALEGGEWGGTCGPTGSCCDESTGTCVDDLTEAECSAMFGLNHTWSEGNTCENMTCPV